MLKLRSHQTRTLCLASSALLTFACWSTPSFARGGVFQDIPRGHWASKAIGKLLQTGMIQGKSGSFEGERAFTRYEMAVVLARYMEKLEVAKQGLSQSVEKTYPLVKKLAKELSQELDILGVKTKDLMGRLQVVESRQASMGRELQELRSLVEENRRLLAQIRSGNRASAPIGLQASAPPPAPAYRPVSRPTPAASLPGRTSEGLFASQIPQPATLPPPVLPAAQRLRSIRERARGLLEKSRTPTRAETQRVGRFQVASRPSGLSANRQGLMDTIQRVESGEMDLSAARRYGRGVERELHRTRRSPSSSQIYPLSERLFGPVGLGPQVSD